MTDVTQAVAETEPTDPTTPQPEPDAPTDPRQRWICLDPEGSGTPTGHPTWHSDNHLAGIPVVCPTCRGKAARMAQEGE